MPTSACLPKQPGPSIVYLQDLLLDTTPTLFTFKLIQAAADLWYVEVYNRRNNTLALTTGVYAWDQEALSEAKQFVEPYLRGLAQL